LFYLAAHLMDSVQDRDEPDDWWSESGPAVALNAASGLYFSAAKALAIMHERPAIRQAAAEINRNFYDSFLVMSSGQLLDLTVRSPTLAQYWAYAEAKSGAFFALGCHSGARLASDDPDRLSDFRSFGHHLGLWIQIRDDLGDIQAARVGGPDGRRPALAHSLPVIYAWEVSPDHQRKRIQECLQASPLDEAAARELLSMLDACGASTYLEAELDQHRRLALEALERTDSRPPSGVELAGLLEIR
jgi:geranylgeranyl pyrophosphate synthase